MVRAASTRVSNPLPTGASAYRIDMPDENTVYSDIKAVSKLFDENSASQNAMWMGRETFNNVYKYVIRYFERYFVSACKVLFTVVFEEDNMDEGMRIVIVDTFKDLVQSHLRHSDIMVCPSSVQVFLVLPEVEGAEINRVTDRIISAWKACEYSGVTKIQCETESIDHSDEDRRSPEKTDRTDSVVIVDDNKANLSIASLLLKKDGLITHTLQSGRALLDFLKTNHPDLILLDVMMPEMDGYEFAKTIREGGSTLPILMVTAKLTHRDKKEGFLAGTDDYMTKPVDEEELLWRITALLRRSRIASERKITVGSTVLDYSGMTVTEKGVRNEPPQKEFLLLFKLLSYPGQIFTRRQLMDEIWAMDCDTDERTVDVHVNRLRDRFRGNEDFEIVTVRGLGYKAVYLK